jgi:hypothetical protein
MMAITTSNSIRVNPDLQNKMRFIRTPPEKEKLGSLRHIATAPQTYLDGEAVVALSVFQLSGPGKKFSLFWTKPGLAGRPARGPGKTFG